MKTNKIKKGIYRNGQKLNWKKNILFYGCDLETTTENTEYYKRTGGSTVYAISLMRVPVNFKAGKKTNTGKDEDLNKFVWLDCKDVQGHKFDKIHKVNLFGKIDQIWNYFLNDIKVGRSTIIYLYFHNGQKWDYTFIYEWCKKQGWENVYGYPKDDEYDEEEDELVAPGLKTKLKELLKTKQHCYSYGKDNNWVSMTIYLYHPKGYHIRIELRDSFKLLTQSIKSIGHDFFSKDVKGNYYQELQTNPWYLLQSKAFGDDCLTKQPLNVDAVQDVKDDVVYYDDKTNKYEYPLLDSTKWPSMIKERVATDTIILCFALGYGLVKGIWTVLHSNKVPQTTGASAVNFFASMLVDKNNPDNIRDLVINKRGEHKGKVNNDTLWNNVYGCSVQVRIGLERWFTGKLNKLDLKTLDHYLELFNKHHHTQLDLVSLPNGARGGFTEGLPSIKGKTLQGYYISGDVNSEYPFGATQPLPYGEPTYLNTIPPHQDNKWWMGWFYVKHIKMTARCIQPLLKKVWSLDYSKLTYQLKEGLLSKKEKDEYYRLYPKDEHYVYELTNAIIPWGEDEYNTYILKHPEEFEIEDFWPIIILLFDAKPWAKRFMEENYKIKQQASKEHNNTMKLSAKLKLNSLTGKFDQKYIQTMNINLCDYPDKEEVISMIKQTYYKWGELLGDDYKEMIEEELLKQVQEVRNPDNSNKEILIDLPSECKHSYIPGYSAITSKGRALIHNYSLELVKQFGYDETKIKLCYSDTDSMKIWTKDQKTYDECIKFMNDQHWLDDNELGKLKEEFKGKVKYFKYLCPKKYLGGDENKQVLFNCSAISGISRDDLPKDLKMDDIGVLDVKQDMKPQQIKKLKKYCSPFQNTFLVSRPKHVPGGIILTKQEMTLYSFMTNDGNECLDNDEW